jgi:single-stranded-DNA-specific exonuclease
MAAGLTVRRDHVNALAERLKGLAARDLSDREPVSEIRLDLELDLRRIGQDLLRWLDHLGPFGAGNPHPVLAVRGVQLARPTRVGTDGGHLKLVLRNQDVAVPAIAFGMGRRVQEARSLDRADVALEISENRWNGRRELQARLLDFRATGT